MAIHQLILRRTGQRVLRVDIGIRELLRCAGRNVGGVHQVYRRPCVRRYLYLRRAYRGLLQEEFTSQASACQWRQARGIFSDGLKIG